MPPSASRTAVPPTTRLCRISWWAGRARPQALGALSKLEVLVLDNMHDTGQKRGRPCGGPAGISNMYLTHARWRDTCSRTLRDKGYPARHGLNNEIIEHYYLQPFLQPRERPIFTTHVFTLAAGDLLVHRHRRKVVDYYP